MPTLADFDLRYLNAKLDHRAENDPNESFGRCLFLTSINSVGFASFSPVTGPIRYCDIPSFGCE